jgi:hypothetical protein
MYVADKTSGELFADGLDDFWACAESVATVASGHVASSRRTETSAERSGAAGHSGVTVWLAARAGQRFPAAIRAVTTICRTMSPSPCDGSGLWGESSWPDPRVNTVVDQHFGPAWRCEIQIDFVSVVALDADDRALRDNQAGSLLTD